VFTAVLLADMVERGEVRLEDPISRYLCSKVRKLGSAGDDIKLEQLVTHTSGLPRLPRNLMPRALLNRANPYARYTVLHLERALARAKAPPSRQGPVLYSNYGFAVLGYVLSVALERSYEDLVLDRVCRPLGMTETTVRVPPEFAGRQATGHGRDGRSVPDWDLRIFAPAGGLRSTVDDMLRFLAANLHPKDAPIGTALELAQRGRRRVTPNDGIAMGWHIRRWSDRTVLWHNGGTSGFGSFCAFERRRSKAVVALYNSPPTPKLDAACFALLEDLGP
jgi:CubicO group peptidase (beta-lactamase class C family)